MADAPSAAESASPAPAGGDQVIGVGSTSMGQNVTAYVHEVPHETLHLVIDGAIAFGTIAVAVLAIWGDKWRAYLAPPKIELRPHTSHGTPAILTVPGAQMPSGGKHGLYYHLKAVNVGHLTVENCRVLLIGISRRGAEGNYSPTPFPVPFPYIWSGEDFGPELVTVTTERVLDFGRLMADSNKFEPRLRSGPNNFDGYVRRGESVRYTLAIDASNYRPRKSQVFEVNWDGENPLVSARF